MHKKIHSSLIALAFLLLSVATAVSQALIFDVVSTRTMITIDGHPAVSINLSQDSKSKFAKLTADYTGRIFEFRTPEKVLMKARIVTSMLSGELQIVGAFNEDEAVGLARRIALGELKIEVIVLNDQ
jgi:preprotein translocase subunit SecD